MPAARKLLSCTTPAGSRFTCGYVAVSSLCDGNQAVATRGAGLDRTSKFRGVTAADLAVPQEFFGVASGCPLKHAILRLNSSPVFSDYIASRAAAHVS
jgi:hypothetical protein